MTDSTSASTSPPANEPLRIASTIRGHPYDVALYDPILDRVDVSLAPRPTDDLAPSLAPFDVLHMAWPEWWSGTDPGETAQVLAQIADAGVKVAWTQHNLEPHFTKTDEARQCYGQWAMAADLIIHHTDWGRDIARRAYEYRPDAEHVVIPHGHWGAHYEPFAAVDRATVEAAYGWTPCAIRLAIVGYPRVEKRIQDVLDAVAATERDDLQLLARITGDEVVPADDRIIIDTEHLDDDEYRRRMRGIDALVLPFEPEGMLTTGTAFDAIGAGIAAITSDWGFLDETFSGADIRYGSTTGELETCLRALTPARLTESAAAIGALRPNFDWTTIAHRTADALEALR